jgi:hypothetical protein
MLGAHRLNQEEEMSTRTQLVVAIAVGQVVGLLGYIDPLFIPLVLAGPLVTGAVAAARGISMRLVVAVWVSAGLNMTAMDWLLLREDVVFHLVLTVVMSLLAMAGHGVVRVIVRRREGRGQMVA